LPRSIFYEHMITNITFKKYTAKDLLDYHNLVKEDDVMKYITGKGMSVPDANKKFDSILDQGKQHKYLGYFQVLDAENGTIIGDCKLVFYKKDHSVFEIGYLLKKEHWKKGLGTKICEHLLSLALEIDQEKDIIAVIHPQNIASRRLLEKSGFRSYFKGNEEGTIIEKLILTRKQKNVSSDL